MWFYLKGNENIHVVSSKYIISSLTLVGPRFEYVFLGICKRKLYPELSKQNSLRYKTSKLRKFLIVHIDEVKSTLVAKWIRRRFPEPKIAGSNPARGKPKH